MAGRAGPGGRGRATLSKDRVLRAAVRLADEGGIAALTMRRLAQDLGVEAMSLYHHVADKEELLDGIVEVVVGEIFTRMDETGAPSGDAGWKATMRERILTARDVMLGHPWAPGVIESRTNLGPVVMRYYDALAGVLRAGGLSPDLVHHAMHALGSRALGFTQELFDPQGGGDPDPDPEAAAAMLDQMAKEYPYITEMVTAASHDAGSTLGWCDDNVEFEFALDLILDGLERLRDGTMPERQQRPERQP